MEIENWFKKKDYAEGVALYAASSTAKRRTLQLLDKGRSDRNMATLIRELRLLKTAKPAPVKKTAKPKAVKQVSITEKEAGQKEAQQAELKDLASKSYFKKIRYAELPPELRLRFRKLKDIFYNMCDLKFLFNELPDEAEKEALELMLQIDALDEQKDTIWKELDHWQTFKTMLPVKASKDFSNLSELERHKKAKLLDNYIKKKSYRIKTWKAQAEAEENKLAQRKILQQINRTEKSLHQDEINLRKIQERL